jgi:mannose-6-phosphate isomerase-like protein (cupin superfamily)
MTFVLDIVKATLENNDYRRVLYTPGKLQLVLMSLKPGEDIHLEIHPNTDQFFRIESGQGELRIGKYEEKVYQIKDDTIMIVPHNTYHRIVNTGNKPLKLYTIYAPPEHAPNKVDHQRPVDKGNTNKKLLAYLAQLL